MFTNCVLYTDTNANVKLLKNKGESIDGVVSLINAISGYLGFNNDPEKKALEEYLKNML